MGNAARSAACPGTRKGRRDSPERRVHQKGSKMDKETSSRVSSLAAQYLHFGSQDFNAIRSDTDAEDKLATDIRTLAASALAQDETPGQEPATFLDRLNAEHGQLIERRRKLVDFLARGAPGASNEHKMLLDVQVSTMTVYQRVLELRLNDLAKTENENAG